MAADTRRRSSSETGLVLLVAAVLIALCVFALMKARDGFGIECSTGTVDLSDLALSGSPDAWDARITECFPEGVDGVPGSVNSSLLWDQLFIAVYVPTLALLCVRRPALPAPADTAPGLVHALPRGVRRRDGSWPRTTLWLAFYRRNRRRTPWLRLLFATSLAKWVVVLPMLYGLLALTTALSRLLRRDRTPPGGPVPQGCSPARRPSWTRARARCRRRAVAHRYVRPDSTPGDAVAISFSGGAFGPPPSPWARSNPWSNRASTSGPRTWPLSQVAGISAPRLTSWAPGPHRRGCAVRSEAAPDPTAPIQSPEAEHVRTHARYLWPTPNLDRHGAGFVSTASTSIFSILFNLVLATVCIYVIATPWGGAPALLWCARPPAGRLAAGHRPRDHRVGAAGHVGLGARSAGGSPRVRPVGGRRHRGRGHDGRGGAAALVRPPGWWYLWAAGAVLAVGIVGAVVQAVSRKRHPAGPARVRRGCSGFLLRSSPSARSSCGSGGTAVRSPTDGTAPSPRSSHGGWWDLWPARSSAS